MHSRTCLRERNAYGFATVSVQLHDNGGIANGGVDTSEMQTFRISVSAMNDAPNTVNEDYTTSEDVALTIAATGVLGNDSDVEGDSLSAALISGPTHGSVTLNADGSFVYTPAANFNGADSFTYKANDGLLDSAETTVTISISSVNDAASAMNDAFTMDQNGVIDVPVALGVLVNDSDVDGDSLVAQLVSAPNHGSLALNEDGSFTYTPAVGYYGTDAFVYQASDRSLASGDTTVNIDVRQVAPAGSTKFIVVDRSVRDTFEYDAAGNLVKRNDLSPINREARGITTNQDGSLRWVVDSHGAVFVYDQAGKLAGLWIARDIEKAEGIATNGRDLWIVDRDNDRVYFFADSAARRFGVVRPTSSFRLNNGNRNPMDVTTDGVHLWVVDDTDAVDRVFRYSTAGKLEGKWTIDRANARPTGLTIDPNEVNHIWIVDAGTDRVYQYDAATTRLTGSQLADSSFSLAATNRNPQGIADPKSRLAAKKRDRTSGRAYPLTMRQTTEMGGHECVHPVTHLVTSRVSQASTAVKEVNRREEDSKQRTEHATGRMKSASQTHVHDHALAQVMDELDDLAVHDSVESLLRSKGSHH